MNLQTVSRERVALFEPGRQPIQTAVAHLLNTATDWVSVGALANHVYGLAGASERNAIRVAISRLRQRGVQIDGRRVQVTGGRGRTGYYRLTAEGAA